MTTQTSDKSLTLAFWLGRNGILLAGALVSSMAAWWLIAWPVATFSNVASHKGHFALTFVHMMGGTGMLTLGGLNLYLAARKQHYRIHRRVGQGYLSFGTFAALLAGWLAMTPAHKAAGAPVLTNMSVSLLMLATSWLACAGLGLRAARNRRFASHGEWMIRSYVLVWSFVFCRIASRIPAIGELGNGQAFIWLSWVGPLLVCEVLLQWPSGARKPVLKANAADQ
ncbi:MAG: DUF2306 domain-containing protein [Pseudomonadota bacterium]|nr:DUF2306 domain-containing protein [Pseudomonadota bacterium]